jgi:hypothetical protein
MGVWNSIEAKFTNHIKAASSSTMANSVVSRSLSLAVSFPHRPVPLRGRVAVAIQSGACRGTFFSMKPLCSTPWGNRFTVIGRRPTWVSMTGAIRA